MVEWTDEVIVLKSTPLGDAKALLDVYTQNHGRHKGIVYKKKHFSPSGSWQMGDHLIVRWRARLNEQLGTFTGELLHSPAAQCFFSSHALYGLHSACSMTACCVSERDACHRIYEALRQITTCVTQDRRAALHMNIFELTLLKALGYGLDLTCCARTGIKEDLCYVSPRTGRAVSRQAAGAYAPRLLPLPSFFHTLFAEELPDIDRISGADLQNGFTLTEFFFLRHVLHHRNVELPYARTFFIRESIRLWENATRLTHP